MARISTGVDRLAPALAWTGGVLLVFGLGLLGGFRKILGGLGDVRLIHFTLEHGYRWIAGDPLHRDFWSPPIFYPHPGASAYTDVLLGVGPFYWVVRALGTAPDVAFHLWIVMIWTLNFVAAWWLLRRSLDFPPGGAACGAFLFAFGAWRQLNVIHQQLMPSFYLLLSLVALLELFRFRAGAGGGERREPLWIGLFFCGLVLQAWTAFYPLFFFCLGLGAALLWSLPLRASRDALARQLRLHRAAWVAAALLSLAAVAPLAVRYAGAAREVGLRGYPEEKVPRPASWLLMGQSHRLYGFLQRDDGPFAELRSTTHSNGAGPVTTVVALAGLWTCRRRRGVATILLAVATLIVVSTVFPGDLSFWRWIHRYLPGAAAVRAVGRIGMVVLLPVTIGVAAFFARQVGLRRWILASVLGLLCLAEQLHAIAWRDREPLRAHIEAVARRVSPHCEAFLLVSRGTDRYPYTDEDAAWAALAAGVPTVNGRYGNRPPGWGLHETHIKGPKRRQRLRRKLDRWVERHGLDPGSVCWIEMTDVPELVGVEGERRDRRRRDRPPRRRRRAAGTGPPFRPQALSSTRTMSTWHRRQSTAFPNSAPAAGSSSPTPTCPVWSTSPATWSSWRQRSISSWSRSAPGST